MFRTYPYFNYWKFKPFDQHLPISLNPQPPETTILFSVSMSLAILDSIYKWYHTVFVFLWSDLPYLA